MQDTDGPSKWAITKIEAGLIASLLMSAGTMIFTGGVIYSQVQQAKADIAELKTHDSSTSDRLARIETKLDLLLDDQRPLRSKSQ